MLRLPIIDLLYINTRWETPRPPNRRKRCIWIHEKCQQRSQIIQNRISIIGIILSNWEYTL